MFALLGDDPEPITVELTDGHDHYHYVVRREPSGLETPLYAVAIAGDRAYASGDGGVVLARTAAGGWAREATPTDKALRALAVADAELYAVGDAGTVLHRTASGWALEPTPSPADLYDVVAADGRVFAVGDRGTLLERTAGTWRAIETHTEADLRRFDGHVAIGKGGAIVDCAWWDREQRERARVPACVPRPSPTTADLLATFGGEHGTWHAYGVGGVSLAAASAEPIEATLATPIVGDPTISAAIDNHYLTTINNPPVVLVGARGAIVFVSRGPEVHATVPGEPDLAGVASVALDGFAVGARGTIVHLQMPDVHVPVLFLL